MVCLHDLMLSFPFFTVTPPLSLSLYYFFNEHIFSLLALVFRLQLRSLFLSSFLPFTTYYLFQWFSIHLICIIKLYLRIRLYLCAHLYKHSITTYFTTLDTLLLFLSLSLFHWLSTSILVCK